MVLRALALTIVLFLLVLAGCRCRPAPSAVRPEPKPSLRIAVVSSVAGAIEPCGCVEDMLGGIDHAGAYLQSASDAPLLVVGAGPMLFMDPTLPVDRAQQDRWKAEALVGAFRDVGLHAWAPGLNDYALGAEELARLTAGGPALLAANLGGATGGTQRTTTLSVGGLRVGLTGVSRPLRAGVGPEGLTIGDPVAELREAAKALAAQGAALKIALVALPRGEALRLVEGVPDFQLVVLGKAFDQGESNDPVTPPATVGRTLVVEAPNHLQALYVVDLFVKDGQLELVDGASDSAERDALVRRIEELERRIDAAERAGTVAPADLAARRADLAAARQELAVLERNAAPPERSHYRARVVEVRERLGTNDRVKARLDEYYRRVNDHNRVAFRDRKPPPVPEGASGYIGAVRCATCHQQEFAFWTTTPHARAYPTLEVQNKQFNLECVGCHVTGYEEPGGSTVTAVQSLENVQCETCHGPGSRHAENPGDLTLIEGRPSQALCGPKCHHVPHVKPDWSAAKVWAQILGPGHGFGR